MLHLTSSGRGWVDFTRSIDAVTLFGSGFGDLIVPTRPHSCQHSGRRSLKVASDRIQVWLPKMRLDACKSPASPARDEHLQGAANFGRGERCKIWWPSEGEPVEDDGLPRDVPHEQVQLGILV